MFPRRSAILMFLLLIGLAPKAHADMATLFLPPVLEGPVPTLIYQDDKGVSHSLADDKGKYVLLNIWATWCGPCVREMPSLAALGQNADMKNLAVIAVAEDHGGASAVQSFFTGHGITNMPIFADTSGQAPSLFKLRGLPTTILIGPNGNELGRVEGGADWAAADTLAFLKQKMQP